MRIAQSTTAALAAPLLCWIGASATLLVQQPAGEMRSAAAKLLDELDATQRSRAMHALDDEALEDWGYTPRSRSGVSLAKLGERQREAVLELLRATLDERCVQKVEEIRRLEDVLHERESKPGAPATWRDRLDYHVSFFGDPRQDERWAWRFEGHHVSLTFAADGESLAGVTPQFLGANPARMGPGPNTGVRVLADEEMLARALIESLDDERRKAAIVDGKLTGDIRSTPGTSADLEPLGIRAERLDDEQRAKLRALIEVYTRRLRGPLFDAEFERWLSSFDDVRFAWTGSTEPGERCYYRISGAHAVIEFDDSQGGANHVHTLWRDVERDFGGAALRAR